MMSKNELKISINDLQYLINHYFKSNVVKRKNINIIFNDYTIDEIKDWSVERLQSIGFDENYVANEDGKILESIIDSIDNISNDID